MSKIKQLNIRIPDDLIKKIKQSALDQNINLQTWMLRTIIEMLAYEEEQVKKYKG